MSSSGSLRVAGLGLGSVASVARQRHFARMAEDKQNVFVIKLFPFRTTLHSSFGHFSVPLSSMRTASVGYVIIFCDGQKRMVPVGRTRLLSRARLARYQDNVISFPDCSFVPRVHGRENRQRKTAPLSSLGHYSGVWTVGHPFARVYPPSFKGADLPSHVFI